MDSIEDVYKQYAKSVYKFLLSKTFDSDLAEELTQETFFQAVKSIHKFEGKSDIFTWLCSIAKNQLYSYLKKNNKEILNIDEALEIQTESLENVYFSDFNKLEILKILHKFQEPMKEVMYLRITGDLSFKEIGEILGKNENWARVTFYRGKEKLIKEVKKHE